MKIKDSYNINVHTQILIPARHIEYETIVWEKERKLYVKDNPLKIIQKACLNRWSTYEGRRNAVIHHLNYQRKVPIPIDTEESIVAIPTHSPSNFDCHWLILHNIMKIVGNKKQSTVLFVNGQTINLDISQYSARQQYSRAFDCYNMIREKFLGKI